MKSLVNKILFLSAVLATGTAFLAIKSTEYKQIRYDHFITVHATASIDKSDSSIYLYNPRATFIIEKDDAIYEALYKLALTTNTLHIRFNEPYTIDKDGNTIYFGPNRNSVEITS